MAVKPKKEAPKPEAKKQTANVPAPLRAEGGSLVVVGDQMPDYLRESAGAGRGNENVQTDDLVIPRLELIQSVSPEVDPSKPEYNERARPGMMMNSVTKQLYGTEVYVVPVQYTKQWLVWRDRKQGGGFFGAFPDDITAQARAKEAAKELGGTPEALKIEVIDTPTHLCLLIDRERGSVEEIMIPLARTKAKKSREWNSMVRLAGGDRFSRVYRLSSASETNPKGTFFNYVITQFGFPQKPVFQKAEALYKDVAAGKTRTMDATGFNAAADAEEETDM